MPVTDMDWDDLDFLRQQNEDHKRELAQLRKEMQSIYECAYGIMPIHRDDSHLREIIIRAKDARWTRLFAILMTAKIALKSQGDSKC